MAGGASRGHQRTRRCVPVIRPVTGGESEQERHRDQPRHGGTIANPASVTRVAKVNPVPRYTAHNIK
jgi:hypothetical protein